MSTTIDPSILATLASQAEIVAAEHDAANAARLAEIAAAADLLSAVIERVRPALPAISNRIRIAHRVWWPNSINTDDASEYATARGVYLGSDGQPGPEEDYARSNSGSYEGSDLFLLVGGTFLRLAYTGHWSRWQGATSEWTAEQEPLSCAHVAGYYSVDALITSLADTLAKHVGTRAKATERMTSRASTLSAIATLATKGGK